MSNDYTRVHRLLKIITLVQTRGTWTAARLAEECEVTQRTIYRDLKMLQAAGIPLSYDEQSKRYAIRGSFFMPPVDLTLEESLALVALGEQIGDKEQIPMVRAAGRAIQKIRSQLPAPIREQLASIQPHISIKLTQAGPFEGIADVYEAVQAALAGKKVLRCRYESIDRTLKGEDLDEQFEFHPYALFFSQRAWYTVGHHGGRGENRCLKLNRFTMIELTDQSYRIPSDFTLDRHLGNAWRMIRGDTTYDVELWFSPQFAETIAETCWHPTQQIEDHEDGSITFRCKVDGLDEIVWWVLSMGPHCVVRGPAELVRYVGHLIGDTGRRYDRSFVSALRGATDA